MLSPHTEQLPKGTVKDSFRVPVGLHKLIRALYLQVPSPVNIILLGSKHSSRLPGSQTTRATIFRAASPSTPPVPFTLHPKHSDLDGWGLGWVGGLGGRKGDLDNMQRKPRLLLEMFASLFPALSRVLHVGWGAVQDPITLRLIARSR